jgi:uncharacterized protein involved in exopolysaccharide biosynthesis
VIAQDVEAVFPQAVREQENDCLHAETKRLTAIESENAELKASTSRLAALEHRTEALETENAELKAQVNRLATLEAQMKALQKSVTSQQNSSETILPVALNQ